MPVTASTSVCQPAVVKSEAIAARPSEAPDRGGILIVNADDWGRDRVTTQRIFECAKHETVTAASGMVFMEDSERAAEIARERALDIGLHLNLTTLFTAPGVSSNLAARHREISGYLTRRPLAQLFYNPLRSRAFEYVVAAQLNEFQRLYGQAPERIDGHHHMHLCRNVLAGDLLPAGTMVRRNFSFQPGEKSYANRFYRKLVDRTLARRHRVTDLFFSLTPLDTPGRLQKLISFARENAVEIETHPVNREEYEFLMSDELFRLAADVRMGSFSQWRLEARK